MKKLNISHVIYDICSKRINYLHELRKLRDNLRVYYACGYNE